MSAGSFASPRYEPRLSAASSLQAIAGFNDDPLPLDIHVHPEIEVGIVLTGEEWILFGGVAMVCAPGDVWLCAMWEPHGWEIRPPHTRNVVLKFMPEFLGDASGGDMSWLAPFLAPAIYRPRVTSTALRRKVLALGRWLRREVEERRSAWEQVVRVELLHLLIELGRDWESAGLSPPTKRVRLNALARLMPALSLAHSFPWRRVSVREAAAACGLSPSQFQNLFREAMGASFGAFCLRTRLAVAAHQALHTQLPMIAIAEETGFVDDSHLHHCFVKHYGCTPAQYRERTQAAAQGPAMP